MDAVTPHDAQRIVVSYLKVADAHAEDGAYPSSIADLPHSKDIIRAAFQMCVATLVSGGELTPELRDYLEIAYVSLADYVSPECFTLLREYGHAGEALAADRRLATEKVMSDAWRQLSEQSRLAGHLAREISDEEDRLRTEFQDWLIERTHDVDDISTRVASTRTD